MNRTENSSISLVAMFGSWPKKKNIETEISEKMLRNKKKGNKIHNTYISIQNMFDKTVWHNLKMDDVVSQCSACRAKKGSNTNRIDDFSSYLKLI